MKNNIVLAKLIACSCLIVTCATSAFAAATITKDITGTELSDPASWIGGIVPTNVDVAFWNTNSAGTPSLGGNLTISGPVTWSNMTVTAASAPITISGAGPLSIGWSAAQVGPSILLNGNVDLTLATTVMPLVNANINNNPNQFTVNPGRTLTISGPVVWTPGAGGIWNPIAGNGAAYHLGSGGTTVFAGTNVFNSNVYIGIGNSGTLMVSSITNAFSSNNIAWVQIGGSVGNCGTLLYTNNTGTYDAIRFPINYTGGNASGGIECVDMSGTGLLELAGAAAGIAFNETATGSRRIQLQGSTSGAGLVSGSIVNSGTTANLTTVLKTGTGTWTISGTNSYRGGTTNEEGILICGTNSPQAGPGAFGTASPGISLGDSITISSNWSPTLLLNGPWIVGQSITVGASTAATTGIYTIGNTTATNSTLSGAMTLNQNLVVTQATGGVLTISGAIGGAGGLTTTGNTVILSGANTYAGDTTINGNLLIYSNTAPAILGGNMYGPGALQVSGPGGVTISGQDTAPTTVTSGGVLNFFSTQTGATSLPVNDGCGLGVTLSGTSQYTPATLTLGNSTGVTLIFGGVNTTTAPLAPVSLTIHGTVNVKVSSLAVTPPLNGAMPLMTNPTITSVSGYNLIGNPQGVTGHLAVNGNTLEYVVDTEADIWSAVPSGTWDIGLSSSWSGNAINNNPAGSYKQGDAVLFNDSFGSATVIVSNAVNPSELIFNNNTASFNVMLNGGSIGGSIGLSKSGTASLSLAGGTNTFSGATTISGGTVTVGVLASNNVPSDLGQPNSTDPGYLVVNGATLAYGGTTASTDRGVTIGGNNATIGVTTGASTLTLNGIVTGAGQLTKTGNGTLLLDNSANAYSGGTTISAGTLALGGPAVTGTATNIINNATLDVNGQTLDSSKMVTMGNNSTLMNSGSAVAVQAQIYQPVSGAGYTIAGSGNLELDWLNGPGYPNWYATNNNPGVIDLAGTNNNSGLTYVNNTGTTLLSKGGATSALSVYGGLVKIISTSGSIMYSGNTVLLNGGTFDMNGQSQLAGALQSTAALNGGGVLTNSGTGLSTLILSGGGTYTNTIMEGPTGQISIVKTNGGTQTISGTNLFTGGLGVVGTTAGTLNYGHGETNSPIFNYPVTINIGTLNFNVSGTYFWNDSTISGAAGTLGLNNANMVMWLTNNTTQPIQFGGGVAVNAGTLHLVGTLYNVSLLGGAVSVVNGATLIADCTQYNPVIIGGSLTCGATSTNILIFDGTSSVQVGGGITCNGATLTINVTGTPLGVNTYPLMQGTNATGAFNTIPNITGAGLAPGDAAYVATAAGGTVTLKVYQSYLWTLGANGNWSVPGNWSLQPNAAGEVAAFGVGNNNLLTTVALDVPETIGGILFNNTNSFAIAGANALTLNNSGNGAVITVLAGTSNSIATPMTLSENTAVSVQNGGMVLALSGNVGGTGGLSMSGAGTLLLSGANDTYSGGTAVSGGTVKLGNGSALGTALTNTVGGSGTLDLNGQTLNSTAMTNVILMNQGGTLQNSNASPAAVYQNINQPGGTGSFIRGKGNITMQQWSGIAAFDVTNYDTGTLDLTGTNDNAFLQLHTFNGTVLLDKISAANVHAASGIDIEGGLVKLAGTNDDQLANGNSLVVNGGTFDMNGHNEWVGSLAGASSAGVILNNAAGTTNTLTVSLVTGGGNTAYNGTIKDGAGKLALVIGEAGTLGGTNLFTGGLTLNGGVIGGTLTVSNTFPTNLTVSVFNGSVLNLAFGVTNRIAALVLNGVSQAPGVYKSGNSGGFVTGTGALLLASTTGPASPAVLTNSVSGNVLSLSWPSGLGWRLVSQTNSLATGLNPNNAAWTTVPGVGDGSATITISPTNSSVFYKLVYP